jgi:hypothetical protein
MVAALFCGEYVQPGQMAARALPERGDVGEDVLAVASGPLGEADDVRAVRVAPLDEQRVPCSRRMLVESVRPMYPYVRRPEARCLLQRSRAMR